MKTEILEFISGGLKMNWLTIIVVLILAGYGLYGRKRGFIRTVFSIFSIIIALWVTSFISPIISKEMQKNETVVNAVNKRVDKVINFEGLGSKTADQVNFIDKLSLPKVMKKGLLENNTKDVYTAMAVDSFREYICNYITRIIINAGVYLCIMIIVLIGLAIVSETLNLISKLPIINGLNKNAGLAVGLLQGLIVVWIGFLLITALGSSKLGQASFEQINNSVILSFLYDNNLLLTFITNIGKMLF